VPRAAIGAAALPHLVVFARRERARAAVRAGLSRRRWRVTLARSAAAFRATFHERLIDAAVVDVASPDAGARVLTLSLARAYPSVPFVGLAPYRVADGPAIAHAVDAGFVDVLAEGVDDGVLPHVVAAHGFSARFAEALREPPAVLRLRRPAHLAAWRATVLAVAADGRAVRTDELARSLGVSREHLSRSFGSGTPSLKRMIDLVRLLAAVELAKNPGYDLRDVARLLGFASRSHLARTTQRLLRAPALALTRLAAAELVTRFAAGASGSAS
jgi:AraC-like DNA-binding protein